MDNLYSSFYLYRKYEVIGDELIDLGITSIDADGTQEAVMKEECDPACGCPEPIYRWVQTEDTVCVGEEPTIQYRWTACGTTCDDANKYQNNIKEQSLDEGLTWTVVIPEEYSASTLVQQDSYDCGYRTGTTSSSTYCNGDDLYVDVYYRTSRDSGTTWVTASTTPTLVEAGGCATPTIEYRWTQSGTTCIGYDKYQNNIKEQSTDGGTTWTVVIPEEYSASTLIESQSTDCGYVPPTPTGAKFTLTLNDSSTVSAECDSTSAITSGEVSTQYSGSVVSAEIGDCVTSIGNSAFRGCTGLTSVTIEDGVETIGEYAFYNCKSLTSITLPESAVISGGNTFENCSALTSVNIPTATTSIYLQTFRNCYSLTSVTIPSSVTHIGYNAFRNCSGLTSVTVLATTPPTLDSTNAFSGTNDCTIYVPCESVSAYQAATNWSDYASRIEGIPPCGQPTPTACTCNDFTFSPTAFTVSSAATSVTFSYSGCTKPIFNRITPRWCSISRTSYDTGATTGSVIVNISANTSSARTTSLAPKVNDVICQELGINQESGIAPTPTIDGKYKLTLSDSSTVTAECDSTSAVTSGEVAEQYSGTVVNAIIGDCVTSIGYEAFRNCSGLTAVTIPNSVTTINYSAFRDCTGLTSIGPVGSGASVEIPNSVTSIGISAFVGCSGLTSVNIPNGVTSIGVGAFGDCSSLSSCTIGNGVTSIGQAAFNHCGSLTNIVIPDSVTSIGAGVFSYCASLTSIGPVGSGASVEIPNSVTSIGVGAFRDCSGLTSIEIPNSVTSIGEHAFAVCTSLTSCTIGSGVTSISKGAFSGCTSLTNITLPNTVTSIGERAFYKCSGLANIDIPNSVTSIGEFAFSDCSGLTSVTIGNGVTSIGNSAFYNCSSLTSCTIGSGVTSIGNWAFGCCGSLTSVTALATTPPSLGNNVFYNTNNCPIYVPCESVSAYQAAEGWSDYASRIQAIP